MEGPYNIKNLENQRLEVGTVQQPFFYHITTGQRVKESLIFHAQIQRSYHRYTIRQTNAETLNLSCINRKCPAKALVKVPKELGLISVKGEKTKGKCGKTQKTYQLNFSDPRARVLENYIFLPKNSESHSLPSHSVTLLHPVKGDFREAHVQLGLRMKSERKSE